MVLAITLGLCGAVSVAPALAEGACTVGGTCDVTDQADLVSAINTIDAQTPAVAPATNPTTTIELSQAISLDATPLPSIDEPVLIDGDSNDLSGLNGAPGSGLVFDDPNANPIDVTIENLDLVALEGTAIHVGSGVSLKASSDQFGYNTAPTDDVDAIDVAQGGSLTFAGSLEEADADSGGGGAGIFLAGQDTADGGSGALSFDPGAGDVEEINDPIADGADTGGPPPINGGSPSMAPAPST